MTAWRFDFFPVAGSAPQSYEVAGDVLTVNGTAYDLGPLEEGDSLPADALTGSASWLRSEVTRWEGALRLCVVMPYAPAAALPPHVRHPEGVDVTEAGPVPLPTDEVPL